MKFQDLKGLRFGRLTVIERVENRASRVCWMCKCDCGNYTKATSNALKVGSTTSCGCKAKEDFGNRTRTHGDSSTKLYRTWATMKKRCNCENNWDYKHYGGRGISVCDEWIMYEGFKMWALNNGYVEGLSIERIDFNKNYEPSNCTWIEFKDQNKNTRRTHNIEFMGETRSVTEWARFFNKAHGTIGYHIRRGTVLEFFSKWEKEQ